MSKPIGLSELIAEIGNERLMMQPIDQSLVSMNKRKDYNEIAFATEQDFDLNGTSQFGMVIWVDRDELTKARDKLLAD
ncbi:MAG: hypothetical protein CME72_11625 [Halomonadaceae bacterium]|nr:hypothetical protein [Halomonadaceae bacterium]